MRRACGVGRIRGNCRLRSWMIGEGGSGTIHDWVLKFVGYGLLVEYMNGLEVFGEGGRVDCQSQDVELEEFKNAVKRAFGKGSLPRSELERRCRRL